MKYIWKSWKKFARRIGEFQINIILSVIYVIIMIPMSFIAKIFFDKQLNKIYSPKKQTSSWQKKTKQKYGLKWARKM